MTDLDAFREASLAQWSGASEGWRQHADQVDADGMPITTALIDAAEPARGDRVLELACGPGGVGLAVAERVGDAGSVVCSDFSPEMVDVARARVAEAGAGNVRCETLDAERLDVPDASFDVVVSRMGFMLFADPAAAARESRRVLAPGGRFAAAVWGDAERNPWITALVGAVMRTLDAPPPDPDAPGLFRFADPGRLEGLLTGAGFDDVEVTVIDHVRVSDSLDAWWTSVTALSGPLHTLLASLPAETAAALERDARSVAEAYSVDGGRVELPARALVASGRRSS